MALKALKKHLKSLKKEELIKEIVTLHKKFKPVKEYYKMELATDTNSIVEEYKTRLHKEYFTNKGYGKGRASVANKIISDFSKISIFPLDVIELMMYRIELCGEYASGFWQLPESFYKSTNNAFFKLCNQLEKHEFKEKFIDRCRKFVLETEDWGYGYHDDLTDLFFDFFNEKL